MKIERIDILGVNVSNIHSIDLLNAIDDTVQIGSKGVFAYVNIHTVNLANRFPWLRDFLNNAKIAYADGEGIRLGARILGCFLPEKIALTRNIWDIAHLCELRGYGIYLLGSTSANAKLAQENLKRRFPALRVHSHHGYFPLGENDMVVDDIQTHEPNVLIVGFGSPMQEEWIHKYQDRLNVNALLPGGACIDYAAGAKPVCPLWISRIGLEWLFRFTYEPGRLFYRYFVGIPIFLLNILKQRIRGGKHPLRSIERLSAIIL
ncbi:MAG: WecB/TagA/CpsF family glycosyltransferase [Bacteroidota bacterium]